MGIVNSITKQAIYPWTDICIKYVDAKKGKTNDEQSTGFLSKVFSVPVLIGITALASRRFSTYTSAALGVGGTYLIASAGKYGVTILYKKAIQKELASWDEESAAAQFIASPKSNPQLYKNQQALLVAFLTLSVKKAMAEELNKIKDEQLGNKKAVYSYFEKVNLLFNDFVAAKQIADKTNSFILPNDLTTEEAKALSVSPQTTIKQLRVLIFVACGYYPNASDISINGNTYKDFAKMQECNIEKSSRITVHVPSAKKADV